MDTIEKFINKMPKVVLHVQLEGQGAGVKIQL